MDTGFSWWTRGIIHDPCANRTLQRKNDFAVEAWNEPLHPAMQQRCVVWMNGDPLNDDL